MPPDILFDPKPDQPIPPDSWVPWKSFDDDHPWHHTDLYQKQWEALQSPDVQRHLYRIEYGWTGEMPQLSAQTAARYWMDQSTEVEKASCPGQPVKIISESDADDGSEVVFEVTRAACRGIADNDLIARYLVEAPKARNHPVFMFTYVVKGRMTAADRAEGIKLVSSHHILAKPWPSDVRYQKVIFLLQ